MNKFSPKKPKHVTLAEHKSIYKNDSDCKYAILNARCPDGNCPRCGKPLKEFVRIIHRSDEFLCRFCMKHIHIKTDSFLKGMHLRLVDAFEIMMLDCSSKKGLAVLEVERLYGHSQASVESVFRRLREQMGKVLSDIKFENTTVECDEAFVKTGNGGLDRHEVDNRGEFNVFGMLTRCGKAKLFQIEDRKHQTLIPIIEAHCDKNTVLINTDECKSYTSLSKDGWDHKTVNHSKREFAKQDGTTTNGIEGLFSRLKSTIRGCYGSLAPRTLQFVLNEVAFKYTFRNEYDYGFSKLISNMPPLRNKYQF